MGELCVPIKLLNKIKDYIISAMKHLRLLFIIVVLCFCCAGAVFGEIGVTVNISPAATYTFNLYISSNNVLFKSYYGKPTNSNGVSLLAWWSGDYSSTYSYKLEVPGYMPAWANNKTSAAAADQMYLVDGNNYNIYFDLSGYAISGTVKDRSGANLRDIEVHVFNAAGAWQAYVTTNTSGVYSISGVKNGAYLIKAQDPANNYFPQYYNNAFGDSDLTTINISGASVTGRDFSLYTLVTINGNVKDHANVNMRDVWVYAFELTPNYRYLNKVTTNVLGNYQLTVPASMNIVVKYEKDGYFDLYYNNYDRSLAATFNIASGSTSNNNNVILQRISTINGVVSSNTGSVLPGAEVYAFLQSGAFNYVNKTTTAGDGSYTLTVPSSTNIMLRASANTYIPLFYRQAYSQPASTTINLSTATTNNIGFTLAQGGTIQGAVTVYGGTGSVVTVNVEDVNGVYFTSITLNATGGSYTVSDVPAGQWKVKAIKAGCIAEYYGETASTLNATTVNVPVGTISGINIEIAPSWSITGTVNVLGQPATFLGGVQVQAFKWASGWQYIDGAVTDAQGRYTISGGYNTGNIFVKATTLSYQDQLYNGKEGDWDAADTLNMAPGQATTNINFAMYKLGTITGTITNTLLGGGVSGVTVSAFTYDSGWNYVASTLSITGGTYTMYVRPAQALKIKAEKDNFIPELYNNIQQTSSWNLATTVNVSSGGTSANINFGLDPFWTITGNASPAGTLVEVFGYNDWQDYVGEYQVTAAGTYSISGTGNAKNIMVRFRYDAGNYVRVLYPTLNYFSDISVSNRLTVSAGNTYGLDPVTLSQGGTVQGTVTVYGGTGPVVTVNVENTDGKYFDAVTVNANGGIYSVPRIPAGQWKVKALKIGCIGEYYGETSATKDATTVNVTAGGTASPVDIEIAPSWSITGTVNIAGTATPIQGALIQVFKYNQYWQFVAEATTNASGRYTITDGYNTGNVFVKASAPGYVSILYNDKTGDWNSADTLNMTPLSATTNIDLPLYAMATVSGTVRSPTGSVLAGVTISVYKMSDSSLVATGNTNGSGVYAVPVLPRIPLRVVASKQFFLTTAYGSTVNVASGSISPNINITMNQSWRVAGMIYSSRGGIVAGTLVRMCYETSPDVTIISTYADTAGYYELAASEDVTASVVVVCTATGFKRTLSPTLNVVLGQTDITTFSITMQSTIGNVNSIADTIKSGPNPCNPDDGPVHIGFKVNESGSARIRIFTLGRELVYDESIQCVPGYNEVEWEANDLYNESVPNGVYLAYVEVDSGGKNVKKVLKIAILR